MARTRTLLAFLPLTVACASSNATISVTLGGEDGDAGPNALTEDAAVATYVLNELPRGSTTSQPIGTGPISDTNLDLGDQEDAIASLQFVGSDVSSNAVVFGATPFVELAALDGATIPLFVQRKGALARMPNTITDARSAPLLAVTPRGIYYGGGTVSGASDPPSFGGYDLLFLTSFTEQCTVTIDAQSLALVQLANADTDGDTAVAALVGKDGIYEIGLPSCDSSLISDPSSLPNGLSAWSDVAGGQTLMGDDGTAYIVGPSKLDAPSNAILALPPGDANDAGTGPSAAVGFVSKREGAAVAWWSGHGMFIYAGKVPSRPAEHLIHPDLTAGAEIVSSSLVVSKLGDYPLEDVRGLAAAPFDANDMIVAGDTNKARLIDLTCTQGCAKRAWGEPLPITLTASSLFPLANKVFLIVGDDAAGATHVFRMDAASTNEIQLKIPRNGARAVQTETGEVIILGGGSDVPESYFD